MKKQRIVISGMTCTACAKAIERSVGKLEGVHSANVNFATEKLDIEYDENIVDIDRIKESIKKAGYEAWDEEKQEKGKKGNIKKSNILRIKNGNIIDIVKQGNRQILTKNAKKKK